MSSPFRAGFVGLIGLPNAGKSTLMNLFVKEKVSIVTNKPQTTRRRILGICNFTEGQIVFVDAPGVVLNETLSKKGLNTFLKKEAQEVISDSDALICVLNLDAPKKSEIEKTIDLLKKSRKPWFAVITKVDLIQYRDRIQVIKELLEEVPVFEFSILWGADSAQVIETIQKTALELLPKSPHPLYDINLYTPHSLRELSSEIIREKGFDLLYHEVPYQLAIRMREFDESREDLIKIIADIIVPRESHKALIIGEKGETLKKWGIEARKELEKFLGKKVFLRMTVVHRPKWFSNPMLMKELGYSHDSI